MALPVRLGTARSSDIDLLPYAQRGELWFAGTGIDSFTTSQYLRVLFSNPVGSGKKIYVTLLRFFAVSTLAPFVKFRVTNTGAGAFSTHTLHIGARGQV